MTALFVYCDVYDGMLSIISRLVTHPGSGLMIKDLQSYISLFVLNYVYQPNHPLTYNRPQPSYQTFLMFSKPTQALSM